MDRIGMINRRVRQLKQDLRRNPPLEERAVIRRLIKELNKYTQLWERVEFDLNQSSSESEWINVSK